MKTSISRPVLESEDCRGEQGFTLIELLVVLVIVGLLAGMLLPALAKGKERARRIQCGNNHRQWGVAMMLYASEHQDFLPREKGAGSSPWDVVVANSWEAVGNLETNGSVWYNSLPQLLGLGTMRDYGATEVGRISFLGPSLFTCPTAKPDRNLSRPQFSTGMNSKLIMDGQVPRFSAFQAPVQTSLMAEAGVPTEIRTVPAQPEYDGRPHIYANRFSTRHAGIGTVLFADGHTGWLRAAEVVRSDGKAQFPSSRIVWTVDPSQDPN